MSFPCLDMRAVGALLTHDDAERDDFLSELSAEELLALGNHVSDLLGAICDRRDRIKDGP